MQLRIITDADKLQKMTKIPHNLLSSTTFKGSEIEFISQYRYLGFLIDESLTFVPHVQQLVKRLKVKLGFYFRINSCLSFEAKKRLVAATFMSFISCCCHCLSWCTEIYSKS